jgi:HSP20 family molecular chaperone IbpA
MSLFRIAPIRFAHSLRPRPNAAFRNLFDHDPFFARFAPILNQPFAPFQGYEFPQRFQLADLKEAPKAYHLDLEVPGFRKNELSMDVLDSPLRLRISGTRHTSWGNPEGETAAGTLSPHKHPDAVETVQTESTEAATGESTNAAPDTAITEAEGEPTAVQEAKEVYDGEGEEDVWFNQSWAIPGPIDKSGIKAKLDHGILKVVIPKKEGAVEHKVTIE